MEYRQVIIPSCPVHPGLSFIALAQEGGDPPSRFYRIAHRISDRLDPEVRDAFLQAVEDVRATVDLSALESAVRSGDVRLVQTLLGAERLKQALGAETADLRSLLTRAYGATGEASGEALAAALGVDFTFDFRDPLSIQYARTHTGTLIKWITDDQLLAVRGIMDRAQVEGIPPRKAARYVHQIVGIRQDWAGAPLNLRQEILDGHAAAATSRRLDAALKAEIRSRIRRGTVTEEWLDKVQERYAHSLRRRRALDIARTETLRASNAGQRQSWRDAQRKRVIPDTARRFWVVTPDERLRETHAQVPLDNPEGVALDQPFDTFLGPVDGPPLETNCRCGEALVPNPAEGGIPL